MGISTSIRIIFILGINGLLALKDIANKKGWKISANEHFDPVSEFSSLNVRPQLEAIRKTHTRIVVLNTLARYTVVILTQAFKIGMLKDWVWIVTDGSTNTVSPLALKVPYAYLQYCAKVMQTTIASNRRYLNDILLETIYREAIVLQSRYMYITETFTNYCLH